MFVQCFILRDYLGAFFRGHSVEYGLAIHTEVKFTGGCCSQLREAGLMRAPHSALSSERRFIFCSSEAFVAGLYSGEVHKKEDEKPLNKIENTAAAKPATWRN